MLNLMKKKPCVQNDVEQILEQDYSQLEEYKEYFDRIDQVTEEIAAKYEPEERPVQKESHSREDSMEFIAYSRMLLRELLNIRKLISAGNTDQAMKLLEELIADTKTDICG